VRETGRLVVVFPPPRSGTYIVEKHSDVEVHEFFATMNNVYMVTVLIVCPPFLSTNYGAANFTCIPTCMYQICFWRECCPTTMQDGRTLTKPLERTFVRSRRRSSTNNTMSGKGKGKGGRGEKKSTTASAKAGLQFPVGRIGRYLRQGKVR
jgi:hypothetical protein